MQDQLEVLLLEVLEELDLMVSHSKEQRTFSKTSLVEGILSKISLMMMMTSLEEALVALEVLTNKEAQVQINNNKSKEGEILLEISEVVMIYLEVVLADLEDSAVALETLETLVDFKIWTWVEDSLHSKVQLSQVDQVQHQ